MAQPEIQAPRFKSLVNSAKLLEANGCEHHNTNPRFQPRLGVDTSSACISAPCRWRGETSGLLEMERSQTSRMPNDTNGVGRELAPARLRVRLLGAVEIILDGRRL